MHEYWISPSDPVIYYHWLTGPAPNHLFYSQTKGGRVLAVGVYRYWFQTLALFSSPYFYPIVTPRSFASKVSFGKEITSSVVYICSSDNIWWKSVQDRAVSEFRVHCRSTLEQGRFRLSSETTKNGNRLKMTLNWDESVQSRFLFTDVSWLLSRLSQSLHLVPKSLTTHYRRQ